jgi:hypothetical protein
MRRLSLLLLPFLAAFALVFGLFYLYAAVRVMQSGRPMGALLLFLFGLVGVALAVGIWVARRRFIARQEAERGSAGAPPA